MNERYLCTIPNDQKMTREFFASLIRRFRHHKNIRYGFSQKHTADIMAYRKEIRADEDSMPSNIYSIPVEWNSLVTYVK